MRISLLATGLLTAPLMLGQVEQASSKAEAYVCPPCGAECHFTTSPKPGACGVCGMTLVSLAVVPQVGVLLYPGVAASSSLALLALLAESNAVRAFTVADTNEPLRVADALEVVPQFAFADAPPLDVLVVPEGYGAWEDELLVEWTRSAVERARFVLCVGRGSILLARAGFLASESVPGRGSLAGLGKRFAPQLHIVAEPGWRQSGKFFLARDPEAALDAVLALLAALTDERAAREAAATFGRAFPFAAEEK